MSCFIESEPSAIPELVKFIDSLYVKNSGALSPSLASQTEKLIAANNYKETLAIVAQHQEVLFGEQDAEESLYVVCLLVFKAVLSVKGESAVKEIVEKYVTSLTASETFPLLRMKMLSCLFNLLESRGSAQYVVFVALIKFAAAVNQMDQVAPHFDRVDTLLKEWNSPKDGRRNLYRTIFEVLFKIPKRNPLAHSFLLKYLREFQGETDAELQTAVPFAVRAVVQAIGVSEILQFERYLDLSAVQYLGKGEHNKVFELLNIFATKSLKEYLEFEKANSKVITSLNLTHDDCVRKIRLLSLCSLATTESELPYSKVAECMQIDIADVERWVIRAISAKLIDAKMNQASKTITINSATDRVFNDTQWKQLKTRLNSWEENVRSLAQVVHQVRQTGAA